MSGRAKLDRLIRRNVVALEAMRRTTDDHPLFPPDAEEILAETAAWLWAIVDNIGALHDKRLRLTPSETAVRRAVAASPPGEQGAPR